LVKISGVVTWRNESGCFIPTGFGYDGELVVTNILSLTGLGRASHGTKKITGIKLDG
jgi:hypothetical protein